MKKPFRLFYLLLLLLVSFITSNAQKSNSSTQLCNVYSFEEVNDYGCGNKKFQKTCDEELIWDWGDGTAKTISNEEFVMHQYCKVGTYNVTISLVKSKNIIRDTKTVIVYEVGKVNFSYNVLSHSDCDKSVVQFIDSSTCLFTYCLNGEVIPGSDELEWDFGDGTTSRDLNTQHTYTSG